MSITKIVEQAAVRWLHSINLIEAHPSIGIADREYWAWKTKDFPNGTWQAGLSGFLDSTNLLSLSSDEISKVVSIAVRGTKTIQRANGSFEEAYPFESSYAVTGLVVYNLLYSYYNYIQFFDSETQNILREICVTSYDFLNGCKETHGKISNHVITTELAILFLQKFLNKKIELEAFKAKVKSLQSEEGVFIEYEGADPGYQTLLNHYWTAATTVFTKAEIAYEELTSSLDFVESFVMPNYEFAGVCGSRGTEVLYPSGLLGLNILTDWFELHVVNAITTVNPLVVDQGNFVPVFNSWAYYLKNRPATTSEVVVLKNKERVFSSGGITIKRFKDSCLIWNQQTAIFRGCILKNNIWVDQSCYGFYKESIMTQQSPLLSRGNGQFEFTVVSRKYPDYAWYKAIVLRLLAIIVFGLPVLQRALKLVLKKVVMDNRLSKTSSGILVSIQMESDAVALTVSNSTGWRKLGPYFMRHMASANYFKSLKF